MKITIIAALDENCGIGKAGQMPWHCPADLRQFQEYTMGKVLLMGRKTAQPLLQRLPGRQLLIQSRTLQTADFPVVRSITEALTWMQNHPQYQELVIGGGGEIYSQWLPYADFLRLSIISGCYECDTFFPAWNQCEWTCQKQTKEKEFILQEWKRKINSVLI
ncbi:dihydrofolate reductase [Holdemania massiliensis]|uniref:dihydrofolate reductase n=1 Tax=Holdemania massiliensis TaxID=1468449 RepID=UPI001F061184|nr:dihydrofolate reductase [Holdemania massiliensis]MCH1940812.1 dihydrofolate reductase [Holdemania massiliensis]